ncbi:MAG: hypothetical protein B1H11_04660 [Desulfobacteraceae bacterium 4484_190.1]|nr:MAG: hypothetical protein B1H11_04660 [Desulfobacteraceae bacterium 4484_190.1]
MIDIPRLTKRDAETLKRLAWRYNKTTAETLHRIISFVVAEYDHDDVCESCQDRTYCNKCVFAGETEDY